MWQAGLLTSQHSENESSLEQGWIWLSKHVCQCQQKVEGRTQGINYSLFLLSLFRITSSAFSNFSPVTFCSVPSCTHWVLSQCPILRCISVTSTRDGSREPHSASHPTDSHCQILYVYKSTVPFFVRIRLSLWMKTPPRSHPSFLWWKNACPALPKERGRANAFWQLRQAQEMAAGCPWRCWVPPPCSHTQKSVDVHAYTYVIKIKYRIKKMFLLLFQ